MMVTEFSVTRKLFSYLHRAGINLAVLNSNTTCKSLFLGPGGNDGNTGVLLVRPEDFR